MGTYNIVLRSIEEDEGLTISDCSYIYKHLTESDAIPIMITGEESNVVGFIDYVTANRMNYSYPELEEFITNILADNEEITGNYTMEYEDMEVSIKIYAEV